MLPGVPVIIGRARFDGEEGVIVRAEGRLERLDEIQGFLRASVEAMSKAKPTLNGPTGCNRSSLGSSASG